MAFKSDVQAKKEFVKKLLADGFDSAEVKAKPSDIVATKDGETWYYEIKLTDRTDDYFGAATLTEWEQALKTPDYFRFVIAIRHSDEFEFREFTPDEFMQYSTIPPFKIYFNVNLDGKEKRKTEKPRKAISLTEDKLKDMLELFEKMHNS
jgi:hypothetical protein